MSHQKMVFVSALKLGNAHYPNTPLVSLLTTPEKANEIVMQWAEVQHLWFIARSFDQESRNRVNEAANRLKTLCGRYIDPVDCNWPINCQVVEKIDLQSLGLQPIS